MNEKESILRGIDRDDETKKTLRCRIWEIGGELDEELKEDFLVISVKEKGMTIQCKTIGAMNLEQLLIARDKINDIIADISHMQIDQAIGDSLGVDINDVRKRFEKGIENIKDFNLEDLMDHLQDALNESRGAKDVE